MGGHESEQNPHFPCPLMYSRSGKSTLVGHQYLPVVLSVPQLCFKTPPNLKGRTQGLFGSSLSPVVMHGLDVLLSPMKYKIRVLSFKVMNIYSDQKCTNPIIMLV